MKRIKAGPELGTALPQLVDSFLRMFKIVAYVSVSQLFKMD